MLDTILLFAGFIGLLPVLTSLSQNLKEEVIRFIKSFTILQFKAESKSLKLYNILTARHNHIVLFTQFIFLSIGFFSLLTAFISNNHNFLLVYTYTSRSMPLLYRIGALWSSYEGSLLLLSWQMSLVTIVYLFCHGIFSAKNLQNSQNLNIFSGLQSFIISLFCFLLRFIFNPFEGSDFIDNQGLGLNPTLQDIALALHPPILYCSYSMMCLISSYCCAYIISPKTIELHNILTVSRLTWIFCIAGVALGSWWAYREFGWGGFWFFDPVENISLFGLLSITTFHHSLLITTKQGRLVKWTIFLGIFSFAITLMGILLTRSGLLISLHSFAFNNKTVYLAAIIAIIYLLQFGLFIRGLQNIYNSPKEINVLSKEFGIVLGNIFFLTAILVLFLGTIYPLINFMLEGTKGTMESSFFIYLFIPLILPTLLLAGTLGYMKQNFSPNYIVWILAAINLLPPSTSLIICWYYNKQINWLSTFAFYTASTLVINVCQQFLSKTHYLRKTPSLSTASMSLGHLGYGMLVLSIVLNCLYKEEFDFIGKSGTSLEFNNFSVTLENLTYSNGPNYLKQTAHFIIKDSKALEEISLKPENRFYPIEQALTSEANIYSFLFYDLSAFISRIVGPENVVYAKIFYQPFISGIWLSCLILILSIVIGIFAPKPSLLISKLK